MNDLPQGIQWDQFCLHFFLGKQSQGGVCKVKNLSKVPFLRVVLLLIVSGRGGARCLGMLGKSTSGRPWLEAIMKD